MANSIRNISQSVQEREIIKTAPDVVVYLEGRPYLINPYINSKDAKNQSDGLYTVVSFNDYLDSFTASYDVDNLVPSGSFSLSVPSDQKYLFQAPGGNNIIEPMMQVQVFAKGYFPSQNGNTLYYRVFKGLISNVSHADTGTALQISVNMVGMLRFLDVMYIDLAVALMTNSPNVVVAMKSNQASMNPYVALANTFLRSVSTEGFQLNAVQQASLSKGQNDWADAVQAGYVNRWQTTLTNIVRDVRILGYDFNKAVASDYDAATLPDTLTHTPDDAKGMAPNKRSSRNTLAPNMSPSEAVADKFFKADLMRKYLPEMAVGQITLLDGKIVSRLERIRTLANLLGYEGYQDLDGAIIFKPPFYNLDVTDIGTPPSSPGSTGSGTPGAVSAASYIREGANPFVVSLSEIISESESEDEAAVTATRMSLEANWMADFQLQTPSNGLLPVVEHIDIPKLCKFGLRETPARQMPFIEAGDIIGLYTYAVSELNRANRGYRTYNLSIPLRPELRLGFPMYIPHRDMYGYIKNIGISYQQGGTATMQVMLDTIRKRPLLPGIQTIKGSDGTDRQITTYSSQRNLVMQWTVPPSTDETGALKSLPANNTSWQSPGWLNPVSQSSSTGDSGAQSTDPAVRLLGNPATLPQPSNSPFDKEEWEYLMHRKEKLGSLWATRFDTRTKSFRVQNDKATAEDQKLDGGSSIQVGQPFFRKENWLQNGITKTYCTKVLTCQPYTDEKGYEVVTPFPWGRWLDVNTAISDSRLGVLRANANPQAAGSVRGVNVFLFAGLVSPSSGDASTELSNALNASLASSTNGTSSIGYDSIEMDSVIELQTPKPGDVGDDTSLVDSTQPDMAKSGQGTSLADRLGVFVTGGRSLPNVQALQGTKGTATTGNPTAPAPPVLLQNFGQGGNG